MLDYTNASNKNPKSLDLSNWLKVLRSVGNWETHPDDNCQLVGETAEPKVILNICSRLRMTPKKAVTN